MKGRVATAPLLTAHDQPAVFPDLARWLYVHPYRLIGWIWGANTFLFGLLAVVGLALAVAGVVIPKAVKPIFLALTIVATPIGIVIGEVAMRLIYFGVFLPMGFMFRILRRDALQLKIDRDAKTYWHSKSKPSTVRAYYRQS